MKLLIAVAVLGVICVIVSQIQKNKKQAEMIKSQQQMIEGLNKKTEELEKKQQETDKKETQNRTEEEAYEEMRAKMRELNRQQIENILQRNNHTDEPTNSELAEMIKQLQNDKESEKKTNIPWFAVGTALSKAKNAQNELRKENRELKKAIDKINKMK